MGGNPVKLSKTDWVDRALETPEWQAHATDREALVRRQLKADQRLQERILSDLGVDTSRQRLQLRQEEGQAPLPDTLDRVSEV